MESRRVFFAEVLFSGRVQGVGFRWRTLKIAQEFDVAGTVRNLSDGRVLLCAEGAERVFAVEKEMKAFIRGVEKRTGTREASAAGFSVAG